MLRLKHLLHGIRTVVLLETLKKLPTSITINITYIIS